MYFTPPFLLKEFMFKTSRSGGKGGQNVNKVSTKVQVEFDVQQSQLLTQEEKDIILEKLAGKLTQEGVLQIVAQAERAQLANKTIAIKKMYQALNKCFVVAKKRKPTKVSKAAIEKRLQSKKKRADVKAMRKAVE
jgi:ribosome-associated protein